MISSQSLLLSTTTWVCRIVRKCSFLPTLPINLQLFELFWLKTILVIIVIETNRYVRQKINGLKITIEGWKWNDLIVSILMAFMVLILYMRLKKQLSIKIVWMKKLPILKCLAISNIMTHTHFLFSTVFTHHQFDTIWTHSIMKLIAQQMLLN